MQNYNGNDERSRAVDHVQRSVSLREGYWAGKCLQGLALDLWYTGDVGPIAFAVDSCSPTLGPVLFPNVDIQPLSRVLSSG